MSSLNRKITELHINTARIAQRRDYAELCKAVVKLIEVVDVLERRVYELEDQLPVAAAKTVTPPNGEVPLEWKEDSEASDEEPLAVRAATSFVKASEAARKEKEEAERAAEKARKEAEEAKAAAEAKDEAAEAAIKALAAVVNDKEGKEKSEKIAEELQAAQKKSLEEQPVVASSSAEPSGSGDASGAERADNVAEAEAACEDSEAPVDAEEALSPEEFKTVERYFMRRLASVRRHISAESEK